MSNTAHAAPRPEPTSFTQFDADALRTPGGRGSARQREPAQMECATALAVFQAGGADDGSGHATPPYFF